MSSLPRLTIIRPKMQQSSDCALNIYPIQSCAFFRFTLKYYATELIEFAFKNAEELRGNE